MATPDEIPVGGYVDVTEVITAAGQVEITTAFTALEALLPDPASGDGGNQGATPDYDGMRPEMATNLRAEIAALRAAIAAAPTS